VVVGEGRRSFHDRSFAGLDYESNNMWHVPTMTNNNKVRKEKTKTRPKKAMKTGNTLSLPVLFYKQEHLPKSLSLPLANYKKCCYKQKERFVGLALVGKGLGRQGHYCV
jgi:hypothetical protein